MSAKPLDVPRFLDGLLQLANDSLDIDGMDLQELALECGLSEERPLTQDDMDRDGPWHDHDCEVGDPWYFVTDAAYAFINKGKP